MGIVISVLLLFAGIGVLVLIHVCIVGRSFRRGFSGRNTDVVERGSFGSTSMSQEDIEKLPCFDFKTKEKGSSPAAICAVCLENFKVGEKCRLLPLCNHSFHADCVDLWLLRTPICPICRTCADFLKSESILGEERNHFSETESRIEVGVNQRMEMIHLTENDAQEMQATESGISSETIIDSREIQESETKTSNSSETVIDLSEHQETETDSSSETVIDLSEHQETETDSSSEIVINSRES
ncbi:RING-H2 finger protein ATL56-like [Olea europaea var. sylvestris]|uniref:RING-H2 finger protein ATL56-like n=1 Tax=Olea europaea var. sylvestris TaxID=158386 RepID=UPI000C1CFF89|nr:RING-H2 finger protein ATL56-like [Olea europaea var. sylvestris]